MVMADIVSIIPFVIMEIFGPSLIGMFTEIATHLPEQFMRHQ